MKKVIIIGSISDCLSEAIHEAEIRAIALSKNIDVAFADHEKLKEAILLIEAKNIVNSAFEPEPLKFINHRKEWIEPKIYNDVPRNKFIDKPRHNYKKR